MRARYGACRPNAGGEQRQEDGRCSQASPTERSSSFRETHVSKPEIEKLLGKMCHQSLVSTHAYTCAHTHTHAYPTHTYRISGSLSLEKILVHLVPNALKVLLCQEIPLIYKAPFNTRPKRQNAGSCSFVTPAVSRLRQEEQEELHGETLTQSAIIVLGSGEMLVSFYGKSSLKLVFTEACSQQDGICCHFVLIFKDLFIFMLHGMC